MIFFLEEIQFVDDISDRAMISALHWSRSSAAKHVTEGVDEAYLWPMHHDGGWQIGAWGGFVCVLLAANGLAHDLTDQAVFFFGCAVFLFVCAAWFARARH